MPCYDPETHDRAERLERKVQLLTQLLCGLCTVVEARAPLLFSGVNGLQEWWREHKKVDARLREK